MGIQAAKAIPWKELIKIAPTVVIAARELRNKWTSKSKPPISDPASEIKTQIAEWVDRIEVREASEVDQDSRMKQHA